MWLLDTNVISEVRKTRPHPAVMAWLERTPASALRLAAVTMAELQRGVELSRKPNPDKAREIEAWIDTLHLGFDIVPADEPVFRQWSRLMNGRTPDIAMDALLAATALVHGLTVVTRNVRDFEPLGVAVLNPFESA